MSADRTSLMLALTALATDRTPARITKALLSGGREALTEAHSSFDSSTRDAISAEVDKLHAAGVQAILLGDPAFPSRLLSNGRTPSPLLFARGNLKLLTSPGVGICGSRAASDAGLRAAGHCGEAAARAGYTVISGNARGVDSAAHTAALRARGGTIFVLPEGIHYFQANAGQGVVDLDRALVLSQFAPWQPWANYSAMARNKVIVRLSLALVVVEAGERGGSRAAAEEAFKLRRPVFVCVLDDSTPVGSRRLIGAGARTLSPEALAWEMQQLPSGDDRGIEQDSLF